MTAPVPVEEIRDWLHARPGDRIVLATGCFDLLHAGHLCFLQQAARLGDLLIVGVNSDRSVRRLKGPDRPVVGEHERVTLVGALKGVDQVFLYDESAADTHILLLRPHVFVTSRESLTAYPGELAAAATVGAQVHAIDRVGPYSTTTLVNALRVHR